MAQEPAEFESPEEEEVGREVSSNDKRHNPYSRVGKDSVDAWIRRKEEKRLGKTQSGITRRTGLVSRKGLNPVSKKQKKRNNDYKDAIKEHYEDEANQKCFLCGCSNNLSIHHKKKRGKETSDPFYFVTLCLVGNAMDERYPDSNHSHTGGCHGWVEGNKSIARELKLILD